MLWDCLLFISLYCYNVNWMNKRALFFGKPFFTLTFKISYLSFKNFQNRTWGSWTGDPNKYSRQKYSGGQGCWNGPDRSTEVRKHFEMQGRELTNFFSPCFSFLLFIFLNL